MAWLAGYKYRQKITVDGSVAGAQTDYQMMLNVYKNIKLTQLVDVFADGQEDRYGGIDDIGDIYTFGGSDELGVRFSDIFQWTPGGNPVDTLRDLSNVRSTVGVAWHPGTARFYVFGGSDGTAAIQWYEPATNTIGTCTATLPGVARNAMWCSYCAYNGNIYCFGGAPSTNEILRFDPVADTCVIIAATLTTALCMMTGTPCPPENAIYLFGGIGGAAPIRSRDEIYRFDCKTETIVRLTQTCPYPAEGMACWYNVNHHLIYVCAGCDRLSPPVLPTYHDDIWIFNPENYVITTLAETLLKAMDDFFAVYDEANRIAYLVGTQPAGAPDNSIVNQFYNCKVEHVCSGSDIYLNHHCEDDFDDIRFTESDGVTELDHWRERYTLGLSAIFWVKLDSIPASPNSETFYIYYGNATAVSGSDGPNTFEEFFDKDSTAGWTKANITVTTSGDFLRFFNPNAVLLGSAHRNDLSVGVDVWMMEARLKNISLGASDHVYTWLADSVNGVFALPLTPHRLWQAQWWYHDGAWNVGGVWTEGTEYIFQIKVDEGDAVTGIDYWMCDTDRNVLASHLNKRFSGVGAVNLDQLYIGDWSAAGTCDAYYRFIFIRRYCSPEPTWGTCGKEESYLARSSNIRQKMVAAGLI